MGKLDTVIHRVDIGLRIDLQPNGNFTVKKVTNIGDILIALSELITQLSRPTSLDDLAECYPFARQINLSTGRA